jgi:hypothetical protein
VPCKKHKYNFTRRVRQGDMMGVKARKGERIPKEDDQTQEEKIETVSEKG